MHRVASAGLGVQLALAVARGFIHTMVHFPEVAVTDLVSTEEQITTAHGHHTMTLGAGDSPSAAPQGTATSSMGCRVQSGGHDVALLRAALAAAARHVGGRRRRGQISLWVYHR